MIQVLQSAGLSALMKISPAVRMLPSLASPFKHQINNTDITTLCLVLGSFCKSKINLLVGHYQCDHQENPKAKCESQEIHYSLFCLQFEPI